MTALRVQFDESKEDGLRVFISDSPDSELCRRLKQEFEGFCIAVPTRDINLSWTPQSLFVPLDEHETPLSTSTRKSMLRLKYYLGTRKPTKAEVALVVDKLMDLIEEVCARCGRIGLYNVIEITR